MPSGDLISKYAKGEGPDKELYYQSLTITAWEMEVKRLLDMTSRDQKYKRQLQAEVDMWRSKCEDMQKNFQSLRTVRDLCTGAFAALVTMAVIEAAIRYFG